MSSHGEIDRYDQCPQCLDTECDHLLVYSDGYSKCSSCDFFYFFNETKGKAPKVRPVPKTNEVLVPVIPEDELQFTELKSRGISKKTCEHYKYAVAEYRGEPVQVASYGKAQKLRFSNQKYIWLGETTYSFFGQSLYNKGKNLVITETEVDALSVAEVLGTNWPCVSLREGSTSLDRTFKDNIQFLNNFENIILFINQDKEGVEACDKALGLLPNKVKIAQLPGGFKSTNELLIAKRGADIKAAFWNATTPIPDDIIEMSELTYDDVMTEPVIGYDLPFVNLSNRIKGLRKGEITMLTSGSGMGKSTLSREIAYKLATQDNAKIGNIYLEEGQNKTAQAYIALDNNVPLGDIVLNPSLITKEKFEESKENIFKSTGMLALNHFGSIDSPALINKMEYLALSKLVDIIILDHVSIVISGQESNDERKDLDILMTKMREFTERTGVGIVAIVHLKRPQGSGKSYNERREISLLDLRGSASLEQLSDNVIAIEGNQQDDNYSMYRLLRVLKCRLFGEACGLAGFAQYFPETGRLLDSPEPEGYLNRGKDNDKGYGKDRKRRETGSQRWNDF